MLTHSSLGMGTGTRHESCSGHFLFVIPLPHHWPHLILLLISRNYPLTLNALGKAQAGDAHITQLRPVRANKTKCKMFQLFREACCVFSAGLNPWKVCIWGFWSSQKIICVETFENGDRSTCPPKREKICFRKSLIHLSSYIWGCLCLSFSVKGVIESIIRIYQF